MLSGPEDLRKGGTYFALVFHDPELRLPCVEMYVFLGKDIYGLGEEKWFFQEAAAFVQYGDATDVPAEQRQGVVMMGEDMIVATMLDLRGLLEELTTLEVRS